MSTSDTDRHLVRAGGQAPVRPLSVPAGMSRVGLEERTLSRGDEVGIAGPAAAEGFLYVLAGAGVVSAAGRPQPVAAGDFLGLAPGESVTAENHDAEPLRLLIGFSEGGAAGLPP